MEAARRHSAAGVVGATIPVVTTREIAKRLIDELPESEVEPVVEFIASRQDGDVDLEALLDEEADELLGELDARESKAGLGPAKK
jgi:hypothetical protein